MCYFLYIASPLTLSEVRSMLPRGLTADLSPFTDQQTLKSIHPDAQTVARILAGRCSCDLVRPRQSDTREDERHLRERYRSLGVSRDVAVTAFERHRRSQSPRAPAEGWPGALTKFVAEHARNAGPTLYHLHFSANNEAPLSPPGQPRRVALSLVTAAPEAWLVEGAPTLVSR
jgi:hypothetical protein